MPTRLSSNNYSEDCASPRAAGRASRSEATQTPATRTDLAWVGRHHYLAGRDVRTDRQTVRVIYVHRILSVLSAGRVPRRLLALMKKSAHETVQAISHVSFTQPGTRFFTPFPSLPLFYLSHFFIHSDFSLVRWSAYLSYATMRNSCINKNFNRRREAALFRLYSLCWTRLLNNSSRYWLQLRSYSLHWRIAPWL